MLNGPFHGAVIRSDATRQPAIFSCTVFEQALVINRSSVVQMEANNNRPGHSVQQRHRFTVSAPRTHSWRDESHYLYSYSSAAGGAVKKKTERKLKDPRLKGKEQISTAFLLCMEAVVNLMLSGGAVRLFMGY